MPNEDAKTTTATTESTAATAATTTTETNPNEIVSRGLQRLGYGLAATTPVTAQQAQEKTSEMASTEKAAETAATTEVAEKTSDSTQTEAAAAAAAEQAAVTQPATTATAATAPQRVRKVRASEQPQSLTRDDLVAVVRELVPQKAETTPTTTTTPAVDDSALQPVDREELDIMRYAAEVEPEKFKALPDQYISFVRARDAFVAKKVAEDGQFDPTSDDFKQFIDKNRPTLARQERRRLETKRIEDAALSKARAEIAKESTELRRQLTEIRMTPVINGAVQQVRDVVLSLDDEVVKKFKADPAKALDEHPLEAPVIQQTVQEVSAMTQEYLKIAEGIVTPDPEKNPTHNMLSGFLANQFRLLDSLPEDQRTKDGKLIVSPQKLAELQKAKSQMAARCRVFTDAEVLAMIEAGGQLRIQKSFEDIRSKVAKSGFVKKAAPAPTTAAAQTSATTAAKPATQQAPKAISTPKGSAPAAPAKQAGTSRGNRALGYG